MSRSETRSDMSVFWSSAGGCGVTTVVCAAAVAMAQNRHVLVLDVVGDVGAVLGIEPASLGVRDWLSAARPPADALARLEVARGRIAVLGPGSDDDTSRSMPRWAPSRLDDLARSLRQDRRPVLVDAGGRPWLDPVAANLVDQADTSYLVTRLRRTELDRSAGLGDSPSPAPHHVDCVVAVVEPGRLLRASDVAAAMGASQVVRLAWDPAVAQAGDTGALAHRVPRALRPLARLLR